MGFNLSELIEGGKVKRPTGTVAPKYTHPENPSVTWTGRGRKPKWVEESFSSGKSLDELAV